jgi:hypothetical protein
MPAHHSQRLAYLPATACWPPRSSFIPCVRDSPGRMKLGCTVSLFSWPARCFLMKYEQKLALKATVASCQRELLPGFVREVLAPTGLDAVQQSVLLI